MALVGPLCVRATKIFAMVLVSIPHMLYYLAVRVVILASPRRRRTMSIFCRNDSVWLNLGSQEPMHWVRTVYVLKGGTTEMSLEQVQKEVNDRLVAKHPKLRRRVGRFAGFDVWVDDDAFDIRRHVTYLQRTTAATTTSVDEDDGNNNDNNNNIYTYSDKEELVAAVNAVPAADYDVHKPLWRIFVVPERGTKDMALIFAFSHAIMDGNSLWLNVYPALSDVDENGVPLVDPPDVGKNLNFRKRLSMSGASGREIKNFFKQQFSAPDENPMKEVGKETGRRDVFYPEVFDVNEFRNVTKSFGCSINDIFTSCFTAAILRYCDDIAAMRGQKADWSKWKLSTHLPVSFWAKGEKPKLKNNVSITRVKLPTDRLSPVERLKASKLACDRYIKTSAHPWTNYLLASSSPVPRWLTIKGFNMMQPTVTLSCTNVKGPSKKLVFFGRQVEDLLFFSTLAPDRSPDCLFAMMSYSGKVGVQLTIRHPVFPAQDDAKIVQGYFREELNALNLAAGVGAASKEAVSVSASVPVPVSVPAPTPAAVAVAVEPEPIECKAPSPPDDVVAVDSDDSPAPSTGAASSAESTSGVESDGSNVDVEEDDDMDLDVDDIELELHCCSSSDGVSEDGRSHVDNKILRELVSVIVHRDGSRQEVVTVDVDDASWDDDDDDDGAGDGKPSSFAVRIENECRAVSIADNIEKMSKL